MKIRDIVAESIVDQLDNLAPQAEIDLLDSDADNAVEQAVIDACRELIGQGHTDVEPMVLTNMVVSATGKPFLIKDLVAVNNRSEEIQHYIDSINPSKVKFSTDILTVKNEDPAKEKEKSAAGVSNMAKRAANRNRLGESQLVESIPSKIYFREIERYFSGQNAAKLANLFKRGFSNKPVKVQSDEGETYTATYDCGNARSGVIGMSSCINLKSVNESVVNELDNGPNGTYNDGVRHGVAKDAAKIDYSNYGSEEAAEYKRQQKLQRAVQNTAKRKSEREANKPDYGSIMFKIDRAIGDVFPDGDPFDYLQSKYRGVDIDILNKAVRATKNGRDFYDYVKNVWQQHIDDNPEFGDNPW